MSVTISLCMIVKNEEKNLANCLASVHEVVDEIIIVDTGSTDGTIDIARKYTDNIHHFEWVSDFSAARNFSFSKATMDYIFWLDADDILTPENTQKLLRLKKTLARNVDFVLMAYHYAHDEDGNVQTIITRERLLKRFKNFTWEGAIHETLNMSGNGFQSDIYVTHTHKQQTSINDPAFYRNFQILEQVMQKGEPSWRTLFYYGISLYGLGRDDEALKALHRLFTMPNDSPAVGIDAYLAAHRIYMKKGDHTAALQVLTDHEPLLCDKSEYYCQLGAYHMRTPDTYDEAYKCYMKALQCKGNDRDGVFIERNEQYYYFIPLNSLGLLFYALKMYDESIIYLEKSLACQPAHKKTLTLLTTIKAEKNGVVQ